MLLSFNRLLELALNRVLSVPYKNEKDEVATHLIDVDHINSASIDLVLGKYIMRELPPLPGQETISLRDRTPLHMEKVAITNDGIVLRPGEFILAESEEIFALPNTISSEYKLKSSMARIGLEHLNAGWCDAGWHGSVLTLEIKNMTRFHNVRLYAGDKIGQMVFFEHEAVPEDRSYAARGRYNNDKTVHAIKE